MTTDPLAVEIRAFLAETGWRPHWLGKRALNDPAFAQQVLDKGRSPTGRTAERVRAFMREALAAHRAEQAADQEATSAAA